HRNAIIIYYCTKDPYHEGQNNPPHSQNHSEFGRRNKKWEILKEIAEFQSFYLFWKGTLKNSKKLSL
ncbi:MAG: hypothetical protein LBF22_13280, partial [Deltaproteobacteria bacterium]|nr:hypothetical protein [Deltaproteobacteria bacterium]